MDEHRGASGDDGKPRTRGPPALGARRSGPARAGKQASRMSKLIHCTACGGEVLFADEYVTHSTVRAPALRCASCDTVHLDEALARSPAERESVRLAKAERATSVDSALLDAADSGGASLALDSAAHGSDWVAKPTGGVLLVDDDDIVRAGHARVLRSAGWAVVAEADPVVASKRIASESFDVIVTDLVMPRMSGLELLRAIRGHDLDVPVLILTGRPDLQSAMDAMQYGAFRYIGKPVLPADLVDIVGRARNLHQMARIKREALSLLEGPNWALGDRAGLEARLSSALDSLWVAYQPIVSIEPRRIVAYEALVRTDEPTLRSPVDLFDAADRLGRLHDVARKIRSRVAADASGLADDVLLFVNVHAEDLNDFDLASEAAPLSAIASRVVLELTERASLDRVAGLQTRIERLRELGFRIALDDLGAGYAGLSSFTLLQPDYVKLDASLIRSIEASPQKRSIVKAMLQLAAGDLNLKIISEGVETPEERDTLVTMGAQLLQGYLFARPSRGFVTPTW